MKTLRTSILRKPHALQKLGLLVCVFLGLTFSSKAQNGHGFGIRAGLNYNSNGNYFESIDSNAKNPDRNIGFHVGLYGKIGDRFYFKPEVVYTNTKSDYGSSDFKMEKIDAPLLVGAKVIGPLSVFVGPSLQYIVSSKFKDIKIDDIKSDFTVGLNFGIAANFDGFGVDLRYERGLSKNEATFLDNSVSVPPSRIDTRPDQLILSISFAL